MFDLLKKKSGIPFLSFWQNEIFSNEMFVPFEKHFMSIFFFLFQEENN